MKIGEKEIREARQICAEYKRGKADLDRRITENEEWFRMQHWKNLRPAGMAKRRQTGWLHATIVNKHADFMDNYPECTILPRSKDDEQAAQALNKIIPVVLKRAGFKDSYSTSCRDKAKFGAGCYSVKWDPDAANGLGDVCIRSENALNLFWEPGIDNIQKSRNIFMLELVDHEELVEQYPEIKDLKEKLSAPSEDVAKFANAEQVDTSKKSYVYNWYYKRNNKLHYCRFVQDILLFASENDDNYKNNGWYADGKYPFVIDQWFRDPDSPHGFGLIDTMRETQEDIDELNDAMMQNAKVACRRRYFRRKDAGINAAQFADVECDFIDVQGTLTEDNIKEIQNEPLGANYIAVLQNKVEEMKECSGNRDVTSGGGNQTTAAGIAALQESGSKASRAAIQGTYRAFEEIVEMVIERIRQFYTAPREFRITGDDNTVEYMDFSNAELKGRPVQGIAMSFSDKEPVFDLDVRVSKANVWSRQTQNQDVINFYGMGFFNPQQSTQALACLEVLDIDNKDKLIEVIQRNGLREQFIQQFLPMLLQAAQLVNPQLGAAAMQAAMAAGMAQPQPIPGGGQEPEQGEMAGQMSRSQKYLNKQRDIAQARTEPRA